MSLLCPSKNKVAFKITIGLMIDQNSHDGLKIRGTQEGYVYDIYNYFLIINYLLIFTILES
jgi:hypothetical protein